MKMRKIIAAAAAAALLSAGAPAAAALPDIEGWRNGEIRETKLEAISGSKGTWTERDYRTSGGARLHAVLMRGAGPKGWEITQTNAEDGEVSGGESAENLTIAGRPALLEFRPILGRSITVKLDAENVLTLESKNAEKEEIIAAAEIIVKKMR